jgi:hypothetical protein
MPMDSSTFALMHASKQVGEYHPALLLRTFGTLLFTNWGKYYDRYARHIGILEAVGRCGLRVKERYTIVQAWPYRMRTESTKEDLKVLRANVAAGFKRYIELENAYRAR